MSKSSIRIIAMMNVFNRLVTAYELKAIGGFTDKQIERAVRENILEWTNGFAYLKLKNENE